MEEAIQEKPLEQVIPEMPPANSVTVGDLFSGKIFRVPDYQRAYAWERENWEDFWNDIREGLATRTPHYWGTITLRNTREKVYDEDLAQTLTRYDVVDGQQRLATMYLFFLALARAGKRALVRSCIKYKYGCRMELGSLNEGFLEKLVEEDEIPLVDYRTNRRLKKALEYIESQVEAYQESGGDINDLVQYLQACTISLQFRVTDEGLAIKAFQSLNDRGKDLTLLDRAKSFLMFYSLRYLKNELSSEINRVFGDVFKNYDFIEEAGQSASIEYIKNPRYRFSEDELLRFFYHYFAQYGVETYSLEMTGYDYTLSTENVFKGFLKRSCNSLRHDAERLTEFMGDFLKGFAEFVESFRRLTDGVEKNTLQRKLLTLLGLSATVYPLVISLECENLLDERLLQLIETLDVRVYKVRGTNPRADLYRNTISRVKMDPDPSLIQERIEAFIKQFMRDAEFRTYLSGSIYGNPAVKYILWEFEKHVHRSFEDWDFALFEEVQVEHIFPEETTLSFPACEFHAESDYLANIHKLGNLTLLEETINKRISNKSPENKAEHYQTSSVPGTKRLGFRIPNTGFTKDSIEQRTNQIVDFCLQRWQL